MKDIPDIPVEEMFWRIKVFDSLAYPSVIIAPDKTLVGANKKFYRSYNLSSKELVGKRCHHVFLYKDTPCRSSDCTISKVIQNKKSHSFVLRHNYRWEERTFFPIFDENSDVVYVMASIRDITHTKSLETQLHGVKEFMSQVIYSSASAIVAADRQGNINLMNSMAEEMFGPFKNGNGRVRHVEQLYPPGKAKKIMQMLREEKVSGRGKLLIPKTTVLNSKGNPIQVEMSAAIIYDENGNESATMAIYNSLEDKLKVEEQLEKAKKQLAQSEKMASLGQLAAGVAHEINNPLTGILFYAGLLLENDALPPDIREDLGYILEDANRCKKIVKSLLVYSRSAGTRKNLVQLNDTVEQSLALIRDQKLFRNIRIDKKLSDEMMLVNADSNKLNQVVINLIMNAADAMDHNGTITLTTYKDKFLGKIFLEVKDTGCGIPHEHLSKIFDPFFTTKEVGKSTGLGLSIVIGIIEEHEAKISVKKTGPKGTTFIVEFPMYTASEGGPAALCKT